MPVQIRILATRATPFQFLFSLSLFFLPHLQRLRSYKKRTLFVWNFSHSRMGKVIFMLITSVFAYEHPTNGEMYSTLLFRFHGNKVILLIFLFRIFSGSDVLPTALSLSRCPCFAVAGNRPWLTGEKEKPWKISAILLVNQRRV